MTDLKQTNFQIIIPSMVSNSKAGGKAQCIQILVDKIKLQHWFSFIRNHILWRQRKKKSHWCKDNLLILANGRQEKKEDPKNRAKKGLPTLKVVICLSKSIYTMSRQSKFHTNLAVEEKRDWKVRRRNAAIWSCLVMPAEEHNDAAPDDVKPCLLLPKHSAEPSSFLGDSFLAPHLHVGHCSNWAWAGL